MPMTTKRGGQRGDGTRILMRRESDATQYGRTMAPRKKPSIAQKASELGRLTTGYKVTKAHDPGAGADAAWGPKRPSKKLVPAEKINEIVSEFLANPTPENRDALMKKAGASRSTFYSWVAEFKGQGSFVRRPRSGRRPKLSEEEREEAAQNYVFGLRSLDKVGEEKGVSGSTIRRWTTGGEGSRALRPRRNPTTHPRKSPRCPLRHRSTSARHSLRRTAATCCSSLGSSFTFANNLLSKSISSSTPRSTSLQEKRSRLAQTRLCS
ncbi:hypothetical protein DFJ74DRAFT_748292 [Hyaloraphidium curvatum]|nr:hypothetical protein DFJ74DRAFT_748292 [Hyaloraphidium curvatum]